MANPMEEEIQREIKEHKILIYGKGTKAAPQCGFTVETMQFFDKFGYPYELINVLESPAKREALAKMTNWPTLPKVFINGQFYGDTDVLGPMETKGELDPLLKEAFKNEERIISQGPTEDTVGPCFFLWPFPPDFLLSPHLAIARILVLP